MAVTIDDFQDVSGRIAFLRPVTQETVDWWEATFRGETPMRVAERLCRGMPGDVTLNYSKIGEKHGGFTLEVTASEGNVQVWYHSSTLDLRRRREDPFYRLDPKSRFNQHDVNVEEEFRGDGLVQRLMTNVAAFAMRMHVRRLTLRTDDVGGYMWAKAGAVPVGSWLMIRDAVNSRTNAFEAEGKIDATTAPREARRSRGFAGSSGRIRGRPGSTRAGLHTSAIGTPKHF